MLNRLTRAVKTAVRRRVHECSRTIKHMLRPVRTGAALVCAVSIDAVLTCLPFFGPADA